jgi:hypothetical protein
MWVKSGRLLDIEIEMVQLKWFICLSMVQQLIFFKRFYAEPLRGDEDSGA